MTFVRIGVRKREFETRRIGLFVRFVSLISHQGGIVG
jgi:hypothetical protein